MNHTKLIASAPELLEALECLRSAAEKREIIEGDPCSLIRVKADLKEAARVALEVIKKAKGE